MILSDKDLQMLNSMPNPDQSNIKDQDLKIEFDGTTVLCRVCGDKASGFHYGVHSCEGCKGFFRRSIQQKIQYRPCSKNQQCSILRVNRNRCQYCRLKKCIAVGMSRDAVRFGRVPKREKAKILAAMQCVNARSTEHAMAVELEDEAKLVAAVVSAHHRTCDCTSDKLDAIMQRVGETERIPHMACPLVPNKFIATPEQVITDFSERFSPSIREVVEFAKLIPGFGLLSQDDQVSLLKAGTFEVLLVRLACLFDSRNSTMICMNGQVVKREDLPNASHARFLMDSMFDISERINMLRLLDSEIALFCAVVLIAADRPGLRNADLVEKMQEKLRDALSHAVSHNHSQTVNLMQELLQKIPDLRTLNTLHSEKLLAINSMASEIEINIERPDAVHNHALNHHQQQKQTEEAHTQHYATNMHSHYQTQVSHWNTYGMSASKGTVHCNEDSKGSWDEGDHMVPSPYLPHQHMIQQQQQQQQQHNGVLMHTQDGSHAWSPDSHSDPGKEHELYGGSPGSSSDNGSGSFMADDGSCVRSPMGSLSSTKGSGGDSESICSGEMARLSPNMPKQGHGGSSSGDESCSANTTSSGDNQLLGSNKCTPYKRGCKRKLESPTDSGIESGKEFGSVPSRGTSECSSPHSLVMDEDKLSKESKDEESANEVNKSPNSRLSARDMPVLKRALQAPPLVSTALFMDEAYKPHKKFRALRKDSGSASPTPASPEATVPGRSQSPFPVNCQIAVPTTPSPRTVAPPLPSLASTHSMLVRSLEQAPRMSEQQLKRTDIIHNIIMCNESQQHHAQKYSMNSNSAAYGGSQANCPGPKNASVLPCPPGYYIPQIGANGNGYSSTTVNQANWSNFVAGAQSIASTSSTVTLSSSPVASQVQQTNGSQFSQVSQLQQQLQISQPQQQQTKINTSTAMSPPLHPHQHHQMPQQLPGGGHSPLPRHYYHLQGHQRSSNSAGASPVPRSNPSSPAPPNCKQSQEPQQFTSARQGSPVTRIGQLQPGELRRLMVGSSLPSGENQPLNLSKKVASPPPQMSMLMASLQDCTRSVMVNQQHMKMEVL